MSQSGNLFGNSNTRAPGLFVFGAGAQNSPTNTTGVPPSGTRQPTSAAPSTSVFSTTNATSNSVFGQGPTTLPPTTTNIFNTNNTGMATVNSGITANTRPSNTSGGLFNPTNPIRPQNPTNLFTAGGNIFGTSPTPATNPLNTGAPRAPTNTSGSPWTTTNPSATGKNIFGSPTTIPPNPFANPTAAPQPASNTAANPNTSVWLRFGPQPATNSNLFPQPTATSSVGNTATNNTSKFTFQKANATPFTNNWLPPSSAATGPVAPVVNSWLPPSSAATGPAAPVVNNWLPPSSAATGPAAPVVNSWLPPSSAATGPAAPVVNSWLPPSSAATGPTAPVVNSWLPPSSAATGPTAPGAGPAPLVNNWSAQSNTATTMPFVPSLSSTNLPNPSDPSKTATTSIFNLPIVIGSTGPGAQPTLLSSSSTGSTQVSQSEQIASVNRQNFLAASLLDPYANCGKKHFTNAELIQPPADSTVASTASMTTITTATTATTTTAPTPVPLHIQSNLRKATTSHSPIDMNLKLKPVLSSPTLTDVVQPTTHHSSSSTKPVKSTLGGSFTDEEELVLLGQTKMSKLRLSNHVPNAPSEPNVLRSLYPIRRLAELEKLSNVTPRSSSPTIPITNPQQHITRSLNPSRDASPIRPSSAPLTSEQSSSPIIQRKSSSNNNQKCQLPILTRDFYYMKPSQSELKSLFNDQGQCILKQFTVGHEKYGSVTFYGQINVAGLNLDEIIQINRHEVIVYPDDEHKPAIGEELNLPARITLLDVYPTDRTTREEIRDVERIKAMNYGDYLSDLTKKFDGEFVNYGMTDGSWTFMVKHFTRYGLDDDQDDVHLQS